MTADAIAVAPVTGAALAGVLPALARLRIEVFRDYPYLYDGTLDYEERYIAEFAAAADTVVVVARDRDEIVGMATASPTRGHADAFAEPFRARGYDIDRLFYCGNWCCAAPIADAGSAMPSSIIARPMDARSAASRT